MTYTIVGVIGHIDHGKTTLVGALTGVETDTHPEEKLRGITIDLGFAWMQHEGHQFALIDAPGHQKYIGNLLAGVSAVDVGLLVVACDQGIQEQTLEHAAILQSLGVKKLIAAMSRIDLVDQVRRDELSEELEVFLADYGFDQVPTIPLSATTGEGLDELRRELCRSARTADRVTSDLFRLPIDRVFSVPGRGCVVAGTLWSGEATVGQTVEVASSGQQVRLRELETHGQTVEHSLAGRRTAINVTGVSANELSRGDELVAVGTHQPIHRMLAEVNVFREATALKCPTTVQLHTATTSCAARVTGVKRLEPGETAVVSLETERPVVVTFGQSFLLRCPYPVGSFAAGRFMAPIDADRNRRRGAMEFGRQLQTAGTTDRLIAWVDHHGQIDVDPIAFELDIGIARNQCKATIQQAIDSGKVLMPIDGTLVSSKSLEKIRGYVLKVLGAQAERADDAWLDEAALVERVRTTGTEDVIRKVIAQLVADKQLVRLNRMVAIASDENTLSKKQRAMMDQIIKLYQHERMPPTIKEVAKILQAKSEVVTSLVRFATQQRLLIDLRNGFVISAAMFAVLCRELRQMFDENPERSVAEIRDVWKVTRKHAIPLLEYCDGEGVTVRKGDVRRPGPQLAQWLASESIEREQSND